MQAKAIHNHTYEGHLCIGADQHGTRIVLVNPENRDYTRYRGDSVRGNCFILHFGAYGWTRLMVWEDHLEDALDTAIDWIAEHAPGLLFDDQVNESFVEQLAELGDEEEAWQVATEDMTCGGNCGHYIASYEWGILAENPTRSELLSIVGGR